MSENTESIEDYLNNLPKKVSELSTEKLIEVI
jgi:hypothetical protein